MYYEYEFERFADACAGSCFRGDSTVSVLQQATRTLLEVPLHALKVGDSVRAVDHRSRKESVSMVAALPHSASKGTFVEVKLRDHGDGKAHSLHATEHHTFPLCDTAFRVEKAAMDLKPGDCLLTEGGGKGVVEGVERVAAKPGDQTYTVVLEGADDLVVVGGVVTHARPSKKAQTKSEVEMSTKAFEHMESKLKRHINSIARLD